MKKIVKVSIATSLLTSTLLAQVPKCPFGFNYNGTGDMFCGQYFRTNWSGFEGNYASWHWEEWKKSDEIFGQKYKDHKLAKLIWDLKTIDLTKKQIVDIMSLKASFCLEFDKFSKDKTDKKVLMDYIIELEKKYIPKLNYILTTNPKKS